MTSLANYSTQSTTNPTAALAPIRNAGLQQINSTYAGVPAQVSRQLAARGYGSSGSAGNAMYQTNLQRANAASGLEGQLAQMAQQQGQFGASLGSQLLSVGKGSASDAYGTTWNKGSMTGTSTSPGNELAGGLLGAGGALGDLSKLFGLLSLKGS